MRWVRCLVWIVLVVLGSITAEQICGKTGGKCTHGRWRRWDATSDIYHVDDIGKDCFHIHSDLSEPVSSISSFGIMAPVLLMPEAFPRGLATIIFIGAYLAVGSFLWHASASKTAHSIDVSGFRSIGAAIAFDLWMTFRVLTGNPEISPLPSGAVINVVMLGGIVVGAYFTDAGLTNHVLYIAVPSLTAAASVAVWGREEAKWAIRRKETWIALASFTIAAAGLGVDSHSRCNNKSKWANIHVYGHLFLGTGLFFLVDTLIEACRELKEGGAYKPLENAFELLVPPRKPQTTKS